MPNSIINGVDLYYEIAGKGEPLLLIAGLASDSQSWLPIINDLCRNYTVITFDNRGAGRTKPDDIEITIKDISDDCIALIRELGLSSVNIVGHSMGGFVALDCAIRYPEYLDQLILVGTSAVNSERNNALFDDWVRYQESGMHPELWFRSLFYWLFSQHFFDQKDALSCAVQFAVEYPYQQSKTAFKNQISAIRAFNCLSDLADISAKTLIISGKEDLLFPPQQSAERLQAIPNAVVASIEQAGHAPFVEKPEEFVKCIETFLNRY